MRLILFFLLSLPVALQAQPARKTEHVILITFDGFRWQEVFGGADSSMVRQQKSLKDGAIMEKYWRPRAEDRRKLLLPFLWNTIAVKGQVYGNRAKGSKVNVTNTMWFSYPGYHELLAGFPDDKQITSNDKFYNPNETVLEFIHRQPGFGGKVAAYTSWDVFPYIINDKRSGVYVNAGEVPATASPLTEREALLNQMMIATPNMIPEVRLDALTFYYGLEYMKKNKPRVMFFSFDETDDFAHSGEYAAYLNSAHHTDQFIAELYEYIQSDPVYKDKTTIIITSDHGRGDAPDLWKSHGSKIPGADAIWMAIIGPDTPAGGEMSNSQLYQNQVAATVASMLGLRYVPKGAAGLPIVEALKK